MNANNEDVIRRLATSVGHGGIHRIAEWFEPSQR